jgi:hypothetical protein
MRVADQLRQPAHSRTLQVHVGVVAGHDARVHRRRGQRRQHSRKRRRRVDPAEERRVPVAHGVRQDLARHDPGERAQPGRPARERQREQLHTQVVRQGLPDRPPRQRREVVRDRVDERVPGPPELPQVAGAELSDGRFAHPGSIGSVRRNALVAAGTRPRREPVSADSTRSLSLEGSVRSKRSKLTPPGATYLWLAICIRFPHVSSNTAVVTDSISSGSCVNRTPSARSRSYSALTSSTANDV